MFIVHAQTAAHIATQSNVRRSAPRAEWISVICQRRSTVNPKRRNNYVAASVSLALTCSALAAAADQSTRTVGPQSDGSYVVSNNQRITPAGKLVDLDSPVRAKSVALNPNSRTKTGAVMLMGAAEPIIIFNTVTGEVIQRYTPPTDTSGSFTGIAYSADGTKLLFSQDDNFVAIANVDATGKLTPGASIAIPPPNNPNLYSPGVANPGGVAVANGSIGLVAINAANTLGFLNLNSGKLETQVNVGNAPNHVVVSGNFAYVSNEGGRPATSADFTNLSNGTPIVVDPVDASATNGTVSVVDITKRRLVNTINVGLHPAGMAVSGSTLYVANSYDDTISVIDTQHQRVVKTIKVGMPVKGGAFGAGANDIAVAGDRAYVTLGQSNAIAVVDLRRGGGDNDADDNAVLGYIPAAYFPTSIVYDSALRELVVADDKGLGTQGSVGKAEGVSGYNTHHDTGVVNLIPVPNAEDLREMTAQVISNNRWDSKYASVGSEHVNPNAAPVAIPAHIGEPSLIKHVFLIIKENRTYDQMLGDVPQGNGDASLAVFGANVPNQKALIQRFPLLDNVYAPSRQSADGHPWIVESGSFYSNDIESPDWVRSYPGGNSNDALTYTPRGFLWSQAEKLGLNVKMYGEWSGNQAISGSYSWADFYNTALYEETQGAQGKNIVPDGSVTETTTVPSASAILDPHYPSFNTGIPDQYRVDYYLPKFQQQVATNSVPNLTILWLPDDHTSGYTNNLPAPTSAQADNDLALGRIVEAISHSNVWGSSAIFVEEDDAQDGVDHIDGHRQPVYIISPYAMPPQSPGVGKVIHTTYTAENINRTIENILGLNPLTQFDLTVTPMFDCFQNEPSLAPFNHVAANTALNLDPNGPIAGTGNANFAMQKTPLQKAWMLASNKVMKGKINRADSVDEGFLNHVIWYSATDWKRPYPGESEIKAPAPFVKAAMLKKPDVDD
jgi:YVTN family beta-propeller protein